MIHRIKRLTVRQHRTWLPSFCHLLETQQTKREDWFKMHLGGTVFLSHRQRHVFRQQTIKDVDYFKPNKNNELSK